MKQLTEDQGKMDIVSKLIKEGAIDFEQALKLLESDTQYIGINNYPPIIYPSPITFPIPTYPFYHDPFKTYCDTNTVVYTPDPNLFVSINGCN